MKKASQKFKTFTKVFAAAAVAALMLLSCFSCSSGPKWTVDSATGLTELYIGGIGPTSGEYANYGTSIRDGAKIAVDEINSAGGVNGFKFVFDFQDSMGDAQSAVSAYGKQMDDGMKVSLGGTLSGETASVVAAAKNDKVLVLTPSASAVSAIADNDCAFRVCFSDPAQGTASAKYIKDNALATKVAVIYDSGNDYCKGLYDTFKAEADVNGLQIVSVQTFTESTATDFSAQISAIKDSGAELVFMPIYAADAAKILTQAAQTKAVENKIVFGCDGLDGLLEKIDNKANAEGVMLLTPFAADAADEKVQKFVAAYKAAYNGKVPDQFAANGYDAIYTIAEALKNAKITSEDKDNFNERIVAAMTKITVSGVTGTMTWAADGNTSKDAKAMVIKDGVAVAFTKK